jgi:myo-inositol-1-phosphate synthase
MFVARNLELLAWQGYNVLGNLDGRILEDPANRASKVQSKDIQLRSITGGADLQTTVRIDYVPSLGDWKTAWDFIHFRGFLGTKMSMDFTWRGCDSALAAPLVIDLVRLVDHGRRMEMGGALAHLAAFFKNPLGTDVHDFATQMELLRAYAARHGATRS